MQIKIGLTHLSDHKPDVGFTVELATTTSRGVDIKTATEAAHFNPKALCSTQKLDALGTH